LQVFAAGGDVLIFAVAGGAGGLSAGVKDALALALNLARACE